MHVRKKLPSLGVSTFDSRTNNEEDADSMRKMELSAEAMRKKMIDNEKRDKISMKQPKGMLFSHANDKIQNLLKHSDDIRNTAEI